jgi:hypothetical protein
MRRLVSLGYYILPELPKRLSVNFGEQNSVLDDFGDKLKIV